LNRWSRSSGSGIVQSLARVPLPTFALSTTNGLLVLQTESQVARWDGVEFRFGFAPQLIDGQPFVHALDLQKNIMPLLNGASSPAKTNRVIILDPGHGGLNAGAKSAMGNRYEKEFTLDWARRLALLLAAHGWEVFLTRTNDVDVSLADRVAFAEQHEADLFVSLHFNSSSAGDEQAGLETYCLTPAGMPSTVTRGYGDDLTADFPNNAFDTENLQYALRLHQALLAVNGRLDRGVRRARFLGVLRGQNRPAVLIEGGYLSNPREAQRIGDPAYRQKLAEAAAGALE
jgi:N-acetylmuramoyl-L-alanine amidase